jgi:predicted metal-dependent HD superfamily phosphohydrolase
MPGLDQWRQMWARFGVSEPDASLLERLLARYSEPHRKYHTTRHLDECLAKFEELGAEARHPEEIEFALWFHDGVYDTKREDNEPRSAEWARAAAAAANLPDDVVERVEMLILATRHDTAPRDQDEKIIVDVDLAILGERPERFDEYEKQIREEYAWVPQVVFREKRREILKGFLARPSIFNTREFVEAYEARARANLERSIERLRG